MHKLFLSLSFIIFSFAAIAQKATNKLKNGDLLFQNNECGALCKAINEVTPAIRGQHFSHVGIVSIKGDRVFVLEAIGDAVQQTTLENYLDRSSGRTLVGRVKTKYAHLIPQALSFAEEQLGIPYDDDFIYGNGKYYCSELVYDAFRNANGGAEFFKLFPMTFKAPGIETFFPAWVDYYRSRGIAIPEGEPGCNPGSIGQSKKIKILEYK